MCTICGCSEGASATVTDPETGRTVPIAADSAHPHSHGHEHHDHDHEHHHHDHAHDHADGPHRGHESPPIGRAGTTVKLEQEVLAKNNRLAERNRGWLEGRQVLALNLVSSPGAGKTTLLERTIRDLGDDIAVSVIEGDQETMLDAERIRAAGCRVVQINTGTGCHLEADMLARGMRQLMPPLGSVLMIENVGNLVCPALFDLGERAKVAILSVTEGDDKPLKYPHMFRASSVMILNKIDLLPYVSFNVERCLAAARAVNREIQIFALSATTGAGLEPWYDWLKQELRMVGSVDFAE